MLIWIVIWCLSGLTGVLLMDYIECKIVNKEYDKKQKDNWEGKKVTLTCYLCGVRPSAYLTLLCSFTGPIAFAMGVYSVYNYLKR